MKKLTEMKIYVKTVSEANCSEHWTSKSKRHNQQRKAIAWKWVESKPEITPPCIIKLTRIAPRALDDDNNIMSLKYIRDSIADKIHPGLAPGRADDDKRIKWEYGQERGVPKEYAVKIEVYS